MINVSRPLKRQRGVFEESKLLNGRQQFYRPEYVSSCKNNFEQKEFNVNGFSFGGNDNSNTERIDKIEKNVNEKFSRIFETLEILNKKIEGLINFNETERNYKEMLFNQQERLAELECYIKMIENSGKPNYID